MCQQKLLWAGRTLDTKAARWLMETGHLHFKEPEHNRIKLCANRKGDPCSDLGMQVVARILDDLDFALRTDQKLLNTLFTLRALDDLPPRIL